MLTCIKTVWGKKASKICTETAKKKKKHSSWCTTSNRQRQHCWQTLVKQRQGKGKMIMENPKVSPKRWRKQASYHRVPTAASEGQSFDPFQDTQFIPLWWCCPVIKPQGHQFPPGAAFWLGLIACVAILWLCRWDLRTERSWVKSTARLTSWDTEHSRAVTWTATTVFSPLFLSTLPQFLISYQWSPMWHCRLMSHVWCNGRESATHHEMWDAQVFLWANNAFDPPCSEGLQGNGASQGMQLTSPWECYLVAWTLADRITWAATGIQAIWMSVQICSWRWTTRCMNCGTFTPSEVAAGGQGA